MTENKISIMCPNCKKFLLKINKNDHRRNQILCKHCRKLITYTPSTYCIADDSTYKISNKPPRTTSSGCRFY